MKYKLLFLTLFCYLTFSSANNWISCNSGIHCSVREQVCDSQGKIWFATDNGLLAYDPYTNEYSHYNKENSNIHSDDLIDIQIDNDNVKWFIFSLTSIGSFNGSEFEVYDISNTPIVGCIFNSVAVDCENNKWFGGDMGLYRYDGEDWTLFDSTNSPIYTDKVNSIAVDRFNKIWITLGFEYTQNLKKNIVSFDGENWESYDFDYFSHRLKYNPNTADLWSMSYGGVVYKFSSDGTTTVFGGGSIGLTWQVYIYNLSVIDNQVWLSTNEGLFLYDNVFWSKYDTEAVGIESESITNYNEDPTGMMWISSYKDLFNYDGNYLNIYNPDNCGISCYSITEIDFDSNNNPWLVTKDGLISKNGELWEDHPLNFYYNCSELTISEDDIKWISTEGNGIYKYVNEEYININSLNSNIVTDSLRAIQADGDSVIWLGTINYDNVDIIKYNYKESIFKNFGFSDYGVEVDIVMETEVDKDGNLWVATSNQGLLFFNGDNWLIYNSSNSLLPSDDVYDISINENNMVWIATKEGLAILENGIILVYDHSNSPLYGGTVWQVCYDSDNICWVHDHNGEIYKFDGSEWVEYSNFFGYSVVDINVDANSNKWFVLSDFKKEVLVYNENGVRVVEDNDIVPEEMEIITNYPNPFNPTTTISFALPCSDKVKISIFSITGSKIYESSNTYNSGINKFIFDGSRFASGQYFYKIESKDFSQVRKMLLLK
ncbi:MAG: T9SS type A sorting domain-containing protein [Candidatus Delongbacteria bacterium]|nr:T9SS type A sorting domain-containing protein [Candidatus Delongbacteria bacterium]